MARKKRVNVHKPAATANVQVPKITYSDFMKQRSNPWDAQHVIATGIWQFIQGVKSRFPDDQTQKLCAGFEMLSTSLHELADVEIVPIVLVSYQTRMFEDIEKQREDRIKRFVIPKGVEPSTDNGDGLRGCEKCGNDTTGRLCTECAKQEEIDNGVGL